MISSAQVNDFPQKSHLKYLRPSWMVLMCDLKYRITRVTFEIFYDLHEQSSFEIYLRIFSRKKNFICYKIHICNLCVNKWFSASHIWNIPRTFLFLVKTYGPMIRMTWYLASFSFLQIFASQPRIHVEAERFVQFC